MTIACDASEQPASRDARPSPRTGAPLRPVTLFGGMAAAPVPSMVRYAESLAAELPNVGWRPSLVQGWQIPAIGPRAVRFVTIEFSRHVLYPAAVRGRRADAYHITDHSFAHLLHALPSERAVVTCHDLMPWLVPEIFSRRLGRMAGLPLWERSVRAMERAGHVVCVSECTRRDVLERLRVDPGRTTVMSPGVGDVFRPLPPEERAAARRRLGFPEDVCVVLHVGHSQPYKNTGQAIRVVARLGEMGLPSMLVKVGAVTDEFMAAVAEAGITLHRLTGITDEVLNEAYNAADVLLFPSLYEGFGFPPAEAMRAGLPVVVSDAPALVEVTGGLAAALPSSDVEGMAEAVRAIWEARGDRDVAGAPARRLAETYTWRRDAEHLAAIYERLAG